MKILVEYVIGNICGITTFSIQLKNSYFRGYPRRKWSLKIETLDTVVSFVNQYISQSFFVDKFAT